MEFSKLTYDDYIDNIDFWKGSYGVELPFWAEEISNKGCPSVSAVDFYDDVFGEDLEEHRLPEDYVTGEYGGIAIERVPTNDERKYKGRRITVTKGNSQLYNLIDSSNNFCVIAPVSYAGKSRKNENARYLYALTIEIDNIVPKTGINELFYSWRRKDLRMPQPTYIVCSGTGLHLYFVFERPIPLFQNIFERLSEIKKYLTPLFWNKYVTTSYEHDKIQFESVNQPFRCVGTVSKNGKARAMAFSTGNKITIEYLNKFLPDDKKLREIYKSQLSLEESKELYPEWYQRRIIEGKGRGHWTRHEGIYYNWIEKIRTGAVVGHRYNCLENLCSLAVQCNIPPVQVEKDCWELVPFLDGLTESEDNHFSEYDVICALKTYYNAEETAYRRRIEYITNRTGIQLTANRRNGRTRHNHILYMNHQKEFKLGQGECTVGGRPNKKEIIQNWKEDHPTGTKAECHRCTGIDPKTIRKWWGDPEKKVKIKNTVKEKREEYIVGTSNIDGKIEPVFVKPVKPLEVRAMMVIKSDGTCHIPVKKVENGYYKVCYEDADIFFNAAGDFQFKFITSTVNMETIKKLPQIIDIIKKTVYKDIKESEGKIG